jgi:hypothetical protein
VSRAAPVSDLARLQAAYPAWRITKNIPGVTDRRGFTAVERATGKRHIAATVGELEAALMGGGRR